jgi:hypothetical protein
MRRSPLLALIVVAFTAGCSDTLKTTPATTPTTRPSLDDQRRMEPCHPGCFPSGTLVATPSGPREIQTVGQGETVTLIGAGGKPTTGAVESVFETCNKLIEVRTDAGTLTTTVTQPLCLAAGGFVEAGKLKAGEQIWRWVSGERKAVTVKEVSAPVREAAVFNLVVGDGKVFVANGFLARGKPPTAGVVQ